MKKEPLRVGFDLDGVILYNPARVARPILAFLRNQIMHRPKKEFYIPKSAFEEWFWHILHKTSFVPAPGYAKVQRLVREGKIKAYLITGRYHSLESDFDHWLKRLDARSYFAACVYNKDNEQPHIFKKRMIDTYKIKIFVEDNWDIVHLLNKNTKKDVKILWITNFLDQIITYPYKFFSLRKAVDYIQKFTR